jgi:hypothetical protein
MPILQGEMGMHIRRPSLGLVLALISSLCALESARATQAIWPNAAASIAPLWQEPTNLPKRDLFYGPFGAGTAPDPSATYTFARKKKKGVSPGLVVTDPKGRKWHVKQGREGAPEVVMSRVLSAVGYHQPPVYFLPSFRVAAGTEVEVVRGGRFRLTSDLMKADGEWSWYDNPFVATMPYRGLLVILVMLNSSDLKNSNNVVYDLRTPLEGASRWFVVRDLGTSLGAIGRLDPKPNDIGKFERHRFIEGVSNGYVKFDYGGVHADLFRQSMTTDDVRWACQLLARLTDTQWRDAFRAGDYPPETAARFIQRIQQKIAEGLMVGLR